MDDGAVVPMYQWYTAMTAPFRVAHAFSRFRNRPGQPAWVAMCGREFQVTALVQGIVDLELQCAACRLAVSSYVGP